MPMFKALKACPDATVIKPDMKKYAAAGREVRAMMLDLTPLVEPLSIDEAFMDLAGTEALHHASPAVTLAALARRVEEELSITVSIGAQLQQVPRQDRLGPGQAARLCCDRPGRGQDLPLRQAGQPVVGRGQGPAPAPRQGRHHADRRAGPH